MAPTTICDLLLSPAGSAEVTLERVDGSWRPVPRDRFLARAERLAMALGELGLEPGDRVAVWADAGAWWPPFELAALCRGAVLLPLHPASKAGEVADALREIGARFCIVGDGQRLDRLLERRDETPGVAHLLLVDGRADGDGVSDLASLAGEGAGTAHGALEALARERRPDEPALAFQRFDAAGVPALAVLSHGQVAAGVTAAASALEPAAGRLVLSTRPLADPGEHLLQLLYLHRGSTVAFPESPSSVDRDLGELRPHVLTAAPELFKRVMNRVYDGVRRSSRFRQVLFRRAVGWGRQALGDRLHGRLPGGLAGLRLRFADRRVFEGIRSHFGGRAEAVLSLGTPLTQGWISFFWAAGLKVYEGYGTASAPLVSLNLPGAVELGTAGRPLPGVEVRIAEDGEILVRGPGVAGGDGGWLATGDAGGLDDRGFLTPRGPTADLLDGGVSPSLIERALAADHFIRRAAVTRLDDGTLAALVVPDFDRLQTVVDAHGIDAVGWREILRHGRVLRIFEGEIRSINAALADGERIGAWKLLREDFRRETGELDAAGSLRRPAVLEKYRIELERMAAFTKL